MQVGIDSYSYHRRYGESRAGEAPSSHEPWPLVPGPVLRHARDTGADAVFLESCYLPEHLGDVGEVTLDTSHAGASKVDLLRAHSALAVQLRHVHLSDSNLEVGRDEHRLPGKGRLPLKPFLSTLGASGYTGAVSLELKPWPLGTPDPEAILERMREALRFTREGLGTI